MFDEALLQGSTLDGLDAGTDGVVRMKLALPRWCGRPEQMRRSIEVILNEAIDGMGAVAAVQAVAPASVELQTLCRGPRATVVLRFADGSTREISCRSIELPED